MAASVSSLGVGSNLPLNDLLTSLRNNEDSALTVIQNQQVAVQNRLSAYGKIQSAMATLKSATDALANADSLRAFQSTVSDGAVTASASADAIAGQYSIQVNTLAKAQTLTAAGQTDQTTAIGAGGLITITRGDSSTVTLDLTGKDTSLNGLVSAINSDSSLGINATIINDGTGTPFRLLLAARQTGTNAAATKIDVAGNSSLQAVIGFNSPGAGSLTESTAQNAALQINSIPVTSQTNQIQGVIQGVTLNLAQTNTQASTLLITPDNSVATTAINNFVSAYNGLQSTIQSLTAYDPTTNTAATLTGDSLARRVQNQARAALNVATSSGSIRSLAQMGIKTQSTDGTLTVDTGKLAAALQNNPSDVQSLFSGSTGIAQQLGAVANSFLGSGGLFSTATDSGNQMMNSLQKQYDDTSARIDAKMAVYKTQFVALDTMVAQMNSVSSYLTQQLSMLSNQNSKK